MALVLQNQAATSLEKNLCSIVTVVLLDSQESTLSIDTIAVRIKEKFSLDFDCGEIRNAIIKKGNGSVTLDNFGASLTTPARLRFEREDTLQQRLSLSIRRFMSEYSLKADFNFENLVVSYIYHSFNTNTNNLLYLLKYRSIPEDAKFNATNEEISALNDFLNWEDKEKNEIIYILVSVCFEYCMLTVKKDELLSLKLFQGKRFYLDANIIFRMTGVHTDERKYVTSMFIKKCQEVKIELLYTDETFDEISRVLNSQVECIQSFTEGQAPLSAETLQKLSASYRINDFYRLHYAWCQVRGNNFSDSEAFRSYLFDLTRSVTQGLKYADTSNLPMTQSVEHDNACKSLSDYKEKNKRRKPTELSVKTDISNIAKLQMQVGHSW